MLRPTPAMNNRHDAWVLAAMAAGLVIAILVADLLIHLYGGNCS